ncbi:MAG: glutamate 5-kinase [Pseudohongiellaceae bacterium]
MSKRESLTKARTWVVKIGSSLLTDDGKGLNRESMAGWVAQIARFREEGLSIVLVSSGAVAEGVLRLGLKGRPSAIHEQQAAAAVGQMGLIQAYESEFQKFGLHTAQVLLTHDDLSNRKRYLNARSTLKTLLNLGVVPVVNENDTVVTDEICFGDNDTLAGLVANLINADAMVILTDQDGLYESDPRNNPDAKLVSEAQSNNDQLFDFAGTGHGDLGRGGMLTKIKAARLAARSGTLTCIVNGRQDSVLEKLKAGENVGTLLRPESEPLAARKQWLASHLKVKGVFELDAGAVRMLKESGKSLLPVGIKASSGKFQRGEVVSCVDEQGNPIARGLVNYNSDEAEKIVGHSSEEIFSLLGYEGDHEIIHRDNLVLL